MISAHDSLILLAMGLLNLVAVFTVTSLRTDKAAARQTAEPEAHPELAFRH